MSWDAMAAIGQMLGSVAVLVTLVYLAIQVRHARSEAGRALSQGRGEALRDIFAQQRDERINRLTLKATAALRGPTHPFMTALADQAGFTLEDASLLMWNQIAWWNYFLQIIPRVDELPAMERTQFEVPIRSQYGNAGVGRLFFETYIKPIGHPDAVHYIESLLAQLGPTSSGFKSR